MVSVAGCCPNTLILGREEPGGQMGWTTCPNAMRGLFAPGMVEPKLLGGGEININKSHQSNLLCSAASCQAAAY